MYCMAEPFDSVDASRWGDRMFSSVREKAIRSLLAAWLLALLVAVTLPGKVAASSDPSAHTAHSLTATDTAKLHLIRHSGSSLFEEGTATGTLPGSMRVYCNIGPTLTASFTVYVHGGTITGHGSATIHGSGTYESFSGTLTATGGTGRYARAHGKAGLYGVFNRKNYDLTVQTTGKLDY